MSARSEWLTSLARHVEHGDPVVVGVGVAVLIAASAYCFWRTWRFINHIRLIEDTPTCKIRSAPQGYVELEGLGKLMDGPPIIAKLSGLPCVWYRYKIEEYVATGKGNEHRWQTIDKGTSTEVFWLEDNTGRVVIDPEGADITPRHKDSWRSDSSLSGIAHPVFVKSFVQSRSVGGRYRFTEERLNSGERLYALGFLKNVSSYASAPTVDEEARQILSEWKKDQPQLLQRFDLNKDGKIDEKEWLLARAQARREIMQNHQEQIRSFAEGINVLGPSQDRHRPYILSAFTQKELAQRYRLWAFLYGGGFFLLGVIAVWVFNVRFHG